jgi:hypothetical protein
MCSSAATSIGALVFLVGWVDHGSATTLGAAAVATVVVACVAIAAWRGGSWFFELWATYHDRQVRLFATTSATEFGQVQRALSRAMDQTTEEA